MTAVEGKVNAFVAVAGRAQVDKPAAHGHDVGLDGEVPARPSHNVSGSSAAKIAYSAGSVSPSTRVAPGLTMPAFSRAMCSRVGPSSSVWSRATLVTMETVAVSDVGGVPAPAHTDFDYGDVHGTVGEIPESGRRHSSNQVGRQPLAQQRLEARPDR